MDKFKKAAGNFLAWTIVHGGVVLGFASEYGSSGAILGILSAIVGPFLVALGLLASIFLVFLLLFFLASGVEGVGKVAKLLFGYRFESDERESE